MPCRQWSALKVPRWGHSPNMGNVREGHLSLVLKTKDELGKTGWQWRKLFQVKVEVSERQRGKQHCDIFKGAADGLVRIGNRSLYENSKI